MTGRLQHLKEAGKILSSIWANVIPFIFDVRPLHTKQKQLSKILGIRDRKNEHSDQVQEIRFIYIRNIIYDHCMCSYFHG
jgi:hypothetical protein